MFSSTTLDIFIGLSLIYLLVSMLCAAVAEFIEAGLKMRAVNLHRGISELLGSNAKLVEAIYQHPLITSLYRGDYADWVTRGRTEARKGSTLPSYIPSANFALALADVALGRPGGPGPSINVSVNTLRQALAQNTALNEQVREALSSLLGRAGDDIDRFHASVAAWFDSSMDRVSGWYKRTNSKILFVLGIVFAVLFNVDTVAIMKRLSVDTAMREGLVNIARQTAAHAPVPAPDAKPEEKTAAIRAAAQSVDTQMKALEDPALPLGWQRDSSSKFQWGQIPGWLLTAVAVSLGAPFWFDVLNKFIVIRSTVKPAEKSPTEPSKD
jgi:hypothetical protein